MAYRFLINTNTHRRLPRFKSYIMFTNKYNNKYFRIKILNFTIQQFISIYNLPYIYNILCSFFFTNKFSQSYSFLQKIQKRKKQTPNLMLKKAPRSRYII